MTNATTAITPNKQNNRPPFLESMVNHSNDSNYNNHSFRFEMMQQQQPQQQCSNNNSGNKKRNQPIGCMDISNGESDTDNTKNGILLHTN